MTARYLTVDGMLSGTGLRDSVEGGYLEPTQLGLSDVLTDRIGRWLAEYENAHYAGFEDRAECDALDNEGIRICAEVKRELPQSKVEYYSHALQAKMPLSTPDSERSPTPRG
jgi:hypothetical protein